MPGTHLYGEESPSCNPNGLSSTFVEVSIGGKKLGLVMPQVRTEGDEDDDEDFTVAT